jgi:hypothetical protein
LPVLLLANDDGESLIMASFSASAAAAASSSGSSTSHMVGRLPSFFSRLRTWVAPQPPAPQPWTPWRAAIVGLFSKKVSE